MMDPDRGFRSGYANRVPTEVETVWLLLFREGGNERSYVFAERSLAIAALSTKLGSYGLDQVRLIEQLVVKSFDSSSDSW